MAKPTDEWFGQAFGKAWKDKAEEIGRFNLAIFGKTGVGKSTLVNAIFGSEIAKTGIGEPVTRAEHLYLRLRSLRDLAFQPRFLGRVGQA